MSPFSETSKKESRECVLGIPADFNVIVCFSFKHNCEYGMFQEYLSTWIENIFSSGNEDEERIIRKEFPWCVRPTLCWL